MAPAAVSFSSEPGTTIHQKDDAYYWDTACFSVEGYLFKIPRRQFILGSEYFETTYLRPTSCDTPNASAADSAGITTVTLDGVTANEFRVFLKLLFPIHSASTTLELTKDEWLTILALSTRWHFLAFRRLAIQHLDAQLADAIELVRVGRSAYVPKWVMKGYQALVNKGEAITEEQSQSIGHLTTVKLYIIRHTLQGLDKTSSANAAELLSQLLSNFAEEWENSSKEDARRCAEEDVIWEKSQLEELQRLKEDSEKERKEGEERRERIAEEEQQRLVEEEGKRQAEDAQKRKIQQQEYEKRLREERIRAAKREEELQESHCMALEENRRREEDLRLQHTLALKKWAEAYHKLVKELSHYREKETSPVETQVGVASPRPAPAPDFDSTAIAPRVRFQGMKIGLRSDSDSRYKMNKDKRPTKGAPTIWTPDTRTENGLSDHTRQDCVKPRPPSLAFPFKPEDSFTMPTAIEEGSVGSQCAPDPGPTGKEELYYWDTVCFLVEGRMFKLPKHHFVVGSEYFATKYLQRQARDSGNSNSSDGLPFDQDAPITLEGVSASAFRTFLKLLFPSLTSTLTLSLTKDEWLTILSLSTTWNFLQFRKIAIQQLRPKLTDPIELIKIGRQNFVTRWVMKGYKALIKRNGTISEPESEALGHLTTVRIYLIRGALEDGRRFSDADIVNEIGLKFAEEFRDLAIEEKKREVEEDASYDDSKPATVLREESEDRRNPWEGHSQRQGDSKTGGPWAVTPRRATQDKEMERLAAKQLRAEIRRSHDSEDTRRQKEEYRRSLMVTGQFEEREAQMMLNYEQLRAENSERKQVHRLATQRQIVALPTSNELGNGLRAVKDEHRGPAAGPRSRYD